VQKYLGLE